MSQKQIAVIGGGVNGVCTAYFLAEAGHQVAVIERLSNVAEKASFGNSGIAAPGHAAPWATPGLPKRFLSYLLKPESPILIKPTLDRTMWRWIRQWMAECEPERFHLNQSRMQRIASYSKGILKQLRDYYQIEYEQSQGYLHVFRSEQDVELAKPMLDLLAESDVPHRFVDAEAAHAIEPALSTSTSFFSALYFPEDESGNCPLFTKQLKTIAQDRGVDFHFGSMVEALEPTNGRVAFFIDGRRFEVDAVVVAAGIDSARLLAPLGIQVPLYPVKGYSATAQIRNFDDAPRGALMDDTYRTTITRMGNRIRITGVAELGSQTGEMHDVALRTLVKAGSDWFPDAANYNAAHFWCGVRPTLPDGPPLLGATPIKNLYLNIGHGSAGWALAAGCGLILADIISGRIPEIDMEGLTLARFQ